MGGFLSMLFSPSDRFDIDWIEIGKTSMDDVRRHWGAPHSTEDYSWASWIEWEYDVPFRIITWVRFDRENHLVIEKSRHG